MAYLGVSPSNGVRKVHTYTATASQTTFSGAGAENISLSYRDSTYIDVYQNGVKLGYADYTATSGTSVVLGTEASADDMVVVVVYDVFSVADTVSKTDGGQFDGNITMAGTLGVTGAVTANAGVVVDNITIDGTEIDLSSGNLTLDVAGQLIINSDSGQVVLQDDAVNWGNLQNSSGDFIIGSLGADKDIIFQGLDGSSTIEAMRIDVSEGGKVGIGTTSPDGTLHVHSASAGSVTANSAGDELVVENSGDGGINILTPDANRSALFFGHASDNNKMQIRHDGNTSLSQIISDDALTFNVGDGSERMRIDSSGNLLFNLTNRLFADASNTFNASVVDNSVLRVNRAGTDGTIIDIGKDGTAIGFLGATSGDLFIGTGDVGIRFSDASDSIFAVSGTAGRDNAVDVGNASFRFDDVRATNGTIQTSDRNDKQDIEELSDAEKRVAVVAKGLMRKYRWKDKVAEKGDKARTHFGIIAQDLEDAFKAEGLDASKYAMFCSDTWTNDDGKEQTRLGIRYPQLLAFIISAI